MQIGPRTRFIASIGLLCWAAALQLHMSHLKTTDEFKKKFPDIDSDSDSAPTFSFRIVGGNAKEE